MLDQCIPTQTQTPIHADTHTDTDTDTPAQPHNTTTHTHTEDASAEGGREVGNGDKKERDEILPEDIPEMTPDEKRRIFTSDGFADFFTRSSRLVERALGQSSFDILKDYRVDENAEEGSDQQEQLSMIAKFSDDRHSKYRAVTSFDWSPKHPELVVCAYSARTNPAPNEPRGSVCIWSLNLLSTPEFVFQSQSPIMTTLFSKFSPTIVLGGAYSGQILAWDTRAKSMPVQRSLLSSQGHTHPVFCAAQIGSTHAHNLVTGSTDGTICTWSLDMLSQPQDCTLLTHKSRVVGLTSFSFLPGDLNAFVCGDEGGHLHKAARSERETMICPAKHHGPVTSVHVHPFQEFQDMGLFCSSSVDWTVRLHTNLNRSQPHLDASISLEDYTDYVYDAQWSPTHPALLATADGTGSLGLWNLNDDTEVPATKINVGRDPINHVRWAHDGKRIATGDSAGNLCVYALNEEVAVPRSASDECQKLGQRINDLAQMMQ
eukprot:gnl/Trimastix_PCT/3584.p1 GENE.gnl/Trimastix_PCT/3584~~gnl/Trimastix_PCT/3584.p1  ORF type:complete len:488 (+),score=76.70 gnl/Trimastix_PCT/3584:195-1658(+)